MHNFNERKALGEAARWSVRLAAHDCSADECAEFDQWRSYNDVNRDAFARTANVAAQLDRAFLLDSRLQALAERAYAARPPQPNHDGTSLARYRKFVPAAIAASAVVAMFVAWRVPMDMRGAASDALVLEAPRHAPRQVTLADGSVVSIDAGGELRASITATERRVEMLSGRALFDVAHDASRPFSVVANETRTVALGTRFEVSMQDRRTVVTLAEGSVAIDALVASTGALSWHERLAPGEQLKVDQGPDHTRQKLAVDAGEVSSWASGWLVFSGTPLKDALRDINRYSKKQVLLADASLAELTVSGRFIAGDSESIVNAIAEILPIRVVDGGSYEIMLFKRYDN